MSNIIVVDDDADVTALIVNMLSSAGHTVILEDKQKTVLEIILSEKVDLIISDLFMPVMNGLELILAVRKHTPALPIILITGGGQLFPVGGGGISDLIKSAKMFGAAEVLYKPFRKQALLGAVDRLVPS